MRVLVLAFCLFLMRDLVAQKYDLSAEVAALSMRDSYERPSPRRTLLRVKGLARYNPLSYFGIGLLYLYQNVVSEQIQADCVYQTSCSEYTKQSIGRHGFFLGTLKGFNQLSECFNGAIYEHPRLFISSEKKIINSTGEAAD